MAARINLRSLVDSGDFTYLQSKLERYYDSYNLNTNDENVNRCCEIIELNAKLQRKLFKLLADVAAEGGIYSNARALIRSRFYPFFYEDYYLNSATASALLARSTTLTNDLIVYETLARKNCEIEDLKFEYERDINHLENELQDSKYDNIDLRNELDQTKEELYIEKRRSTGDKIYLDSEINELKAKLKCAELKLIETEPKASLVDDLQRQIVLLKDEIRLLRNTNSLLASNNRITTEIVSRSRATSPVLLRSRSKSRSVSPVRRSRATTPSRLRSKSPLSLDNSTQIIRQENLISRFNEMFAKDRLDAMDILRVYSDNYENNQRILFTVLQEAFSAAKKAFIDWKIKVRSTVSITHNGPDTLEEAVQDYINRNVDLYDLPSLVSKVTTSLTYNPKISLPVGVSYTIISSFIREACRLAWHMNCLAYSLDIAFSLDAEVFDETKYRRSYDSEFTAPLVNHHIWPCLVQGARVIVKGEVCTKRGASLSTLRSRTRSPPRKGILRSQSPSPTRLYTRRAFSPLRYYY